MRKLRDRQTEKWSERELKETDRQTNRQRQTDRRRDAGRKIK